MLRDQALSRNWKRRAWWTEGPFRYLKLGLVLKVSWLDSAFGEKNACAERDGLIYRKAILPSHSFL